MQPPSDILALFSLEAGEHTRRLYPSQLNGTEQLETPHTLEEYALDHFRPPPKVRKVFYSVQPCVDQCCNESFFRTNPNPESYS